MPEGPPSTEPPSVQSADAPPLSSTDFASAVTAITSAFGDPTRRDIYLFARSEDDGVTAAQVAERFDLHPNVARHHLDKLAAGSYLEVSVARGGSGAGRPSKRYRAGADQVELAVPVRHDDLLVTLLGRALALIPDDQASTMAEEVGAEYGRTMAAAMGTADVQRSFRAALHSVADALTAHGFAAKAEPDQDGRLRIISEHCPFGDTAIEHPVICAVDRGMVRGMLESLYGEATPATESSLAMGDQVCITAVDG